MLASFFIVDSQLEQTTMAKKFDVVVIGAGAAGLMCAAEAGKRGRSVLVVDHGKKPPVVRF
ncbi:putative thiazole biosynthetic enzyme [Photobacterium damselae subsp. piscicida]|nr:putative thiazole biosynthetic enzyme [Photobacterium damselae subsp. piscicida]